MLISIIIPAYNAQGCLARALDSALGQTHQAIEILVVDDCSTDGTVALVDAYAQRDSRVRLLRNPENAGPSAARNRGIAAATGEWIALLDADDSYHPQRLADLGAAASRHEADVVFDNLFLYDAAQGHIAGTALRVTGKPDEKILDSEDFFRQCITGRSAFDYGQFKAFMRRSFLQRHLIKFPENLRHGEDFILYAKLFLAGAKVLLVNTPYYYFTQRVTANSVVPSPFSRTKMNFSGMRSHTLELLDHPVVRNDERLGTLLDRRATAIVWHASASRMYPFVKQRKFGGLLILAMRDWRVPALLAEKVFKRLRKSPTRQS
jgi:succinoglycan biosynthesis protein ExoO